MLREMLHLYSGDKVEFTINETIELVLKPVNNKVKDIYGKLAHYKKKRLYHLRIWIKLSEIG